MCKKSCCVTPSICIGSSGSVGVCGCVGVSKMLKFYVKVFLCDREGAAGGRCPECRQVLSYIHVLSSVYFQMLVTTKRRALTKSYTFFLYITYLWFH